MLRFCPIAPILREHARQFWVLSAIPSPGHLHHALGHCVAHYAVALAPVDGSATRLQTPCTQGRQTGTVRLCSSGIGAYRCVTMPSGPRQGTGSGDESGASPHAGACRQPHTLARRLVNPGQLQTRPTVPPRYTGVMPELPASAVTPICSTEQQQQARYCTSNLFHTVTIAHLNAACKRANASIHPRPKWNEERADCQRAGAVICCAVFHPLLARFLRINPTTPLSSTKKSPAVITNAQPTTKPAAKPASTRTE